MERLGKIYVCLVPGKWPKNWSWPIRVLDQWLGALNKLTPPLKGRVRIFLRWPGGWAVMQPCKRGIPCTVVTWCFLEKKLRLNARGSRRRPNSGLIGSAGDPCAVVISTAGPEDAQEAFTTHAEMGQPSANRLWHRLVRRPAQPLGLGLYSIVSFYLTLEWLTKTTFATAAELLLQIFNQLKCLDHMDKRHFGLVVTDRVTGLDMSSPYQNRSSQIYIDVVLELVEERRPVTTKCPDV